MSKHTLLSTLREAIFGDPVKKQYERVEDAVKYKAKCVSDAEFDRTMANFYTERVLTTDPNYDWWAFADAKQKQHDHQLSCVLNEQRVSEADKRANAEIDRYMKVTHATSATTPATPAASTAPFPGVIYGAAPFTVATPGHEIYTTADFLAATFATIDARALCRIHGDEAPCSSCVRLQKSQGVSDLGENGDADAAPGTDAGELPPRG